MLEQFQAELEASAQVESWQHFYSGAAVLKSMKYLSGALMQNT